MRNSQTWNAWRSMKERCGNPNSTNYHRYGARGITYDPNWELFSNFLADMGKCPERVDQRLSLDRIDNNGPYCKENCRWATCRTQTMNSRQRSDNTSGLRGVYHEHRSIDWVANAVRDKTRIILYKGPDFFGACCARRSWEVTYTRGEA